MIYVFIHTFIPINFHRFTLIYIQLNPYYFTFIHIYSFIYFIHINSHSIPDKLKCVGNLKDFVGSFLIHLYPSAPSVLIRSMVSRLILVFFCHLKRSKKKEKRKKERNYISRDSTRTTRYSFFMNIRKRLSCSTRFENLIAFIRSFETVLMDCLYTQFCSRTRESAYSYMGLHTTSQSFLISRIIYNLKAIDELGNKLSVFSLLLPPCW